MLGDLAATREADTRRAEEADTAIRKGKEGRWRVVRLIVRLFILALLLWAFWRIGYECGLLDQR